MTLYQYTCATCGDVELRHPMAEAHLAHACPVCGGVLRRKLTPVRHFWPAQYRPGFEQSGQRMILDPDWQARKRDEFAEKKEAHVNRTEAAKKLKEAGHDDRNQ